jgi:hypothetical protein
MAYATVEDVEKRITRELTEDEESVCSALLDDAGIIIDAFNASASADIKNTVSCRMVIRALGDGDTSGFPLGASQGSMSGLSYSQSWTMGAGGGVGELYLSKLEKELLGYSNKIGSYSPVQGTTGVSLWD